MSSNVGKKHRSSEGTNFPTPHINFAQLDFSAASASPLLLVAAVAAAQQQQRQLLQLKQQQEQKQKLLEEEKSSHSDRTHTSTPSSVHSMVWQRSPPPTKDQAQVMPHKIRKLKLYSVDEKIDIIDYAKVIGNRAAGREFNVAESSIREWRKNEDRLRGQSERSANGTQRFEVQHPDLISKLDSNLVEFIAATQNVDWYAIRDKARDLWPNVIKGADLDDSDGEVNITMGWVTRFMKRNESRVPRIAPPVIATANAANGHNGSVTMVRKASPFAAEGTSQSAAKPQTSVLPSPSISTSPTPTSSTSTSRRKCAQPKRAVDATLLLTPEKSTDSETAEPEAKRPKEDEKQQTLLDAIIKVC